MELGFEIFKLGVVFIGCCIAGVWMRDIRSALRAIAINTKTTSRLAINQDLRTHDPDRVVAAFYRELEKKETTDV